MGETQGEKHRAYTHKAPTRNMKSKPEKKYKYGRSKY